MQRNKGKHENARNQTPLQENQRNQGNISCKDGLNIGHKWYGPNTEAEDIKKRR